MGLSVDPLAICRRPTSTKTRIETPKIPFISPYANTVADQHPLKQGLKLKNLTSTNTK